MQVRLNGVYPPGIIVFDQQGQIDLAATARHADFLIEKGVDGITYLGTTGEFCVLTQQEKKDFLTAMSKHIHGRTRILAGVGSTCLQDTMDLLKTCEQLAIDGALLLLPYFSVYADDMMAAYVDYVASNTPVPIILYNFPALVGYCIYADWVRPLIHRHANLVGIKQTVQDINCTLDMLALKKERPDFAIYGAYDDQFEKLQSLGVDGYINSSANYSPEATIAMYRAKTDEERKAAAALVERAMEVYACSTPLFLAVKQAVYERVLNGQVFGERLPALPLPEAQRAKVKSIVQRLG